MVKEQRAFYIKPEQIVYGYRGCLKLNEASNLSTAYRWSRSRVIVRRNDTTCRTRLRMIVFRLRFPATLIHYTSDNRVSRCSGVNKRAGRLPRRSTQVMWWSDSAVRT